MVFVLGLSLLMNLVASLPESTYRCPSVTKLGQTDHLPHPTDCGRYFTCIGFTPVEQRCPRGLEWNTPAGTCDIPDVANCSSSALQDASRQIAVAGVVGKCRPQLSRCPVAANPTEEVIFMPHADCRKFYACDSKGPVELSCPRKLYWNHASCQCDYERAGASDCVADSTQPPVPSAHHRVRRADEATTAPDTIQSGATVRGVSSLLVLIVTMVLNV